MFFKEDITLQINTVDMDTDNYDHVTARFETTSDCTDSDIEFTLLGVDEEEEEAILTIDYAGHITYYTMPYKGKNNENDFYWFVVENFAEFRMEATASIITNTNNYYEED